MPMPRARSFEKERLVVRDHAVGLRLLLEGLGTPVVRVRRSASSGDGRGQTVDRLVELDLADQRRAERRHRDLVRAVASSAALAGASASAYLRCLARLPARYALASGPPHGAAGLGLGELPCW